MQRHKCKTIFTAIDEQKKCEPERNKQRAEKKIKIKEITDRNRIMNKYTYMGIFLTAIFVLNFSHQFEG